ncbi:MAG: NAD-dependent epimerase, partial [Gillisia sp.]
DYAISKHGAEIEVWRGTQEGLPAVIINPGVILGPGFWHSGSGQIFERVAKGLNYYFPKVTGFVGVKDVAETSILAMESAIKNEQFLCVSQNVSFKELLIMVSEALEKPAPKKLLTPQMIYVGWFFQSIAKFFTGAKKQISRHDAVSLFKNEYYSNEKITKEFNFEFIPIPEVIRETANIYKKERKN